MRSSSQACEILREVLVDPALLPPLSAIWIFGSHEQGLGPKSTNWLGQAPAAAKFRVSTDQPNVQSGIRQTAHQLLKSPKLISKFARYFV